MKLYKQEHDTEDLCEWIIEYQDKLLHISFGVFTNTIQEASRRIHPVDLAYDEPAIVEYYILLTDEIWLWDKEDGDLIEIFQYTEKQYNEIIKWLYDQKVG